MADYRITADAKGLTIDVKGVAGQQQKQLNDAFQECQTGRCTCPTDEYDKLDAMDITAKDDEITLRLRAKDGMELDSNAISACLDYTITKTAKP